MLILTRRIGDTVTIGSNISVVVLAVNGKQVRIGIDAPKDVVVHREEIQEKANARPPQKKLNVVGGLTFSCTYDMVRLVQIITNQEHEHGY